MTHPTHSGVPGGGPGHERRDVDVGAVIRFAWGLLGLIVVTLAVSWGIDVVLDRHQAAISPPASPLAGQYGPQEPPAPRLQVDPLGDLERLRASEDAVLQDYGWVDRQKGVVRLPIEQAMKLLVERGGDGGSEVRP
jgi:hypothetical protein